MILYILSVYYILFHRQVNVKCSPHGTIYDCSINHKILIEEDQNLGDLIVPVPKTDEKVKKEYVNNVISRDPTDFHKNKIAFPNCGSFVHRNNIRAMISARKNGNPDSYRKLFKYCEINNCLDGSIMTMATFRNVIEFLGSQGEESVETSDTDTIFSSECFKSSNSFQSI